VGIFPVIDFNPDTDNSGYGPPISCKNSNGRWGWPDPSNPAFTDVLPNPDGSCTFVTPINTASDEAIGYDPFSFDAVFTANLHVSSPGQVDLILNSDDGSYLGIGPSLQGASTPRPVSSTPEPAPPPRTTAVKGYPTFGGDNEPRGVSDIDIVVNFPAAGTYPMEVDYFQNLGGGRAVTLGYAPVSGGVDGSEVVPIPPRTPVSATTTSVSRISSPKLASYGHALTFTATVRPASGPTGPVSFWEGPPPNAIYLGMSRLSGGKASVTTSQLPAGDQQVYAAYPGDGKFAPSQGEVDQAVKQAGLSISATSLSVTHGHLLPTLTWSANFVNGDSAASLSRQPRCTTTAHVDESGNVVSPAAAYPITCAGARDGNYVISYRSGSLTVQLEPVFLTYAGDTTLYRGGLAHLSALLVSDLSNPVVGRTVVFDVGTGASKQTCTAKTTTVGVAACTLTVKVGKGKQLVRMTFGGDPPGNRHYFASAGKTAVVTVKS